MKNQEKLVKNLDLKTKKKKFRKNDFLKYFLIFQ